MKNTSQSKNNVKVLYDCVKIDTEILLNIINNNIEIINLINKFHLNIKQEFHITIHYYGGIKENKIINNFEINQNRNIYIIGYYHDTNAIGLYVTLDTNDINQETDKYHITVAMNKYTKPVYLKELLNQSIQNNKIVFFKEPIIINGINKRIYNRTYK